MPTDLRFEKPIPWPDCLRRHRTMAEVMETDKLLARVGTRLHSNAKGRLHALLQRALENNPPESGKDG